MNKLITLLLISSLILVSAKIPNSTIKKQAPAKSQHFTNILDTVTSKVKYTDTTIHSNKHEDPQKVITTEEKYKKMGKMSLIFGISSFIAALIPYLGIISFPLSIAAIVLGILSLKNKKKNNTAAIVGVTLGISFIVLFIIALIIFLSILAVM